MEKNERDRMLDLLKELLSPIDSLVEQIGEARAAGFVLPEGEAEEVLDRMLLEIVDQLADEGPDARPVQADLGLLCMPGVTIYHRGEGRLRARARLVGWILLEDGRRVDLDLCPSADGWQTPMVVVPAEVVRWQLEAFREQCRQQRREEGRRRRRPRGR